MPDFGSANVREGFAALKDAGTVAIATISLASSSHAQRSTLLVLVVLKVN